MIEHTKTTKTWKFEELTDEQQQKAVEENRAFNVEYVEWWESVYYDAEQVFLKLESFDIGRSWDISGDFVKYAEDTAEKIISEHGDHCDTYATAKEYLHNLSEIDKKYEGKGESMDEDGDKEELNADFLRDILGDYLNMLSKEYEYLTSEEAIRESLIANDYDIDENGHIY